MPKQIKIRIFPDGQIRAETEGIKGPSCTSLIPVLEGLFSAEIVDSSYTKEYYETEQAGLTDVEREQVRDGGL